MQIKSTLRFPLTPAKMTKINSNKQRNDDKCWLGFTLFTVSGSANWCSFLTLYYPLVQWRGMWSLSWVLFPLLHILWLTSFEGGMFWHTGYQGEIMYNQANGVLLKIKCIYTHSSGISFFIFHSESNYQVRQNRLNRFFLAINPCWI